MEVYTVNDRSQIFIDYYVESGRYVLTNNLYELNIASRYYKKGTKIIVLPPNGDIRSRDGTFRPARNKNQTGLENYVGTELITIINDLRGARPYMESIAELYDFRTVLKQYGVQLENEFGELAYSVDLTLGDTRDVLMTYESYGFVKAGYVDAIIDNPVILDQYMSQHSRAKKIVLTDRLSQITTMSSYKNLIMTLPRINLTGKVISVRRDNMINVSDMSDPVDNQLFTLYIKRDLRMHDSTVINIEDLI